MFFCIEIRKMGILRIRNGLSVPFVTETAVRTASGRIHAEYGDMMMKEQNAPLWRNGQIPTSNQDPSSQSDAERQAQQQNQKSEQNKRRH